MLKNLYKRACEYFGLACEHLGLCNTLFFGILIVAMLVIVTIITATRANAQYEPTPTPPPIYSPTPTTPNYLEKLYADLAEQTRRQQAAEAANRAADEISERNFYGVTNCALYTDACKRENRP